MRLQSTFGSKANINNLNAGNSNAALSAGSVMKINSVQNIATSKGRGKGISVEYSNAGVHSSIVNIYKSKLSQDVLEANVTDRRENSDERPDSKKNAMVMLTIEKQQDGSESIRSKKVSEMDA